MSQFSPLDEKFDPEFAKGTPLYEAVAQLADSTDRSVESMQNLTMGEIYEMARNIYGEALPEFWRNWGNWNLS